MWLSWLVLALSLISSVTMSGSLSLSFLTAYTIFFAPSTYPQLISRRNLIEWYCRLQLRAYRSVFKPNEEVSALDNTSRRYAWLKRLLKIHDEEHAHIFPGAWDVSRDLCLQFCQITKTDLSDILAKTASTVGVPLLLQVLQWTLEFETQLENRFLSRVCP